jgi:hypothetical protein
LRAQLVRGARAAEPTHVLHARREPVALSLELFEAQQARTPERFLSRKPPRADGHVREASRDDLRELALQTCDLGTQRAPGGSLVKRLDQARGTVERQLLSLTHASDSSSYAGTREFYQRAQLRC